MKNKGYHNKGLHILTMILLLFVSLISINMASAHSMLVDSNPKSGEIVEVDLDTIELYFDSGIEPISTVEIYDESDQLIEPKSIEVQEDAIFVLLNQSLPNSSYKVVWKIVAADGHPQSGEYSFLVQKPEEDQPGQEQTTTSPNTETNQDQETNQEQEATDAVDEPMETTGTTLDEELEDEGFSTWWILILAALPIAIAMFFLARRRKR